MASQSDAKTSAPQSGKKSKRKERIRPPAAKAPNDNKVANGNGHPRGVKAVKAKPQPELGNVTPLVAPRPIGSRPLSVAQLVQAFSPNDRGIPGDKYKDEYISVTGFISYMAVSMGEYSVILGQRPDFDIRSQKRQAQPSQVDHDVHCIFDSNRYDFKRGQLVTFHGKCVVWGGPENIFLKDCRLQRTWGPGEVISALRLDQVPATTVREILTDAHNELVFEKKYANDFVTVSGVVGYHDSRLVICSKHDPHNARKALFCQFTKAYALTQGWLNDNAYSGFPITVTGCPRLSEKGESVWLVNAIPHAPVEQFDQLAAAKKAAAEAKAAAQRTAARRAIDAGLINGPILVIDGSLRESKKLSKKSEFWQHKRVEFTGKMISVRKLGDYHIVLILKDLKGDLRMKCVFEVKHRAKLLSLKAGDNVTVRGQSSLTWFQWNLLGIDGDELRLDYCIFAPNAP